VTETTSLFGGRVTELLNTKPIILQLLRFAAIGAINTALDFIIYNYVTKTYDITAGIQLGMLGIVGFVAAIIQSYLWNHAWTFHANTVSSVQNAIRLILVGGLGTAAFAAVVYGAAFEAEPAYYLMILIGFLISEAALWVLFGLTFSKESQALGTEFAAFLAVSVVGLLINSGIVALASYYLAPSLSDTVNPDTIKNLAKAMATGVSLVWNFLGYKLLVFKR
jgi:putative flippase GtrA